MSNMMVCGICGQSMIYATRVTRQTAVDRFEGSAVLVCDNGDCPADGMTGYEAEAAQARWDALSARANNSLEDAVACANEHPYGTGVGYGDERDAVARSEDKQDAGGTGLTAQESEIKEAVD